MARAAWRTLRRARLAQRVARQGRGHRVGGGAGEYGRCVVVCDARVYDIYGEAMRTYFQGQGMGLEVRTAKICSSLRPSM